MDDSPKRLLTDVHSGNAVTRQELHHALEVIYPRAWRWALMCADWQPELASEGLQSAFLALLDGKAVVRDATRLESFVFGVVDRHVRRERRRRYLRRFLALDERTEDPSQDLLQVEARSDARRLLPLLRALPRRQRQLTWLVFGCDQSIEQAARALGIGLGSARTHYTRAKLTLRSRLEAATDD